LLSAQVLDCGSEVDQINERELVNLKARPYLENCRHSFKSPMMSERKRAIAFIVTAF